MIPQQDGNYEFVLHGEYGRKLQTQATFYRCPGCSAPNVGLAQSAGRGQGDIYQVAHGEQRVWLPHRSGGKEFGDGVPPQIASAADEAHRCRSIDAFRGAVILARAVIEATCKHKGAKGGNLRDRIDKLHELALVNELVKDEAHEIRHLGNDMAHGDFEVEVTSKDADDTLTLMAEVLEEVYQRPFRLAARRAAREKEQP